MTKKVIKKKGIVYFKDGHTEEIIDVTLFYDRDEPTCVTYITTTSGCYTFSEALEYETLDKGNHPSLIIKHHCIQFFQKVFDHDGEPYLVSIDDIEQVCICDKNIVSAFI